MPRILAKRKGKRLKFSKSYGGLIIPSLTCQNRDQQDLHGLLVAAFISFIYEFISKEINYDHATVMIPRTALPLEYQGKRYDISFKFGDRIILIEIMNIPERKFLAAKNFK